MSRTFVFLVALIFLSVAGFLALPREKQFDIRDAIKHPFAPHLDLPPDGPAATDQDTWIGEYQRRGYALKCHSRPLPEERIEESNDYVCWGLISKAYDNIPARSVIFFFSRKELRHVKVEFPESSFTALKDYLSRRLAKYPRLDLDTRHQFGTDIYGKPLMVWATANGLVTTSSAATGGQPITVLWSSRQAVVER